jgi:hypothetical protein
MTETRTTKQAQLESKLEEKFRLAVRKILRGRTYKIIPTEKGLPDRLVLLPGGRIELVELKTDTGVVSPKQRLVHSQAALLGTTVHVIRGEAEMLDWVASRKTR